MIRINLLPVEFRQVEVKQNKFSPQVILLSVLFICLLVALCQFFSYAGVRKKIHQSDAEMTQLTEPSKESDQLDQAINGKLLPEKRFFNQYVMSNYLVAEVMNELSDNLPDSVWLADLRFHREREALHLDLTGYSRITSKQIAVAQIQEYVNLIKGKMEEILRKGSKEQEKAAPQEVKVVLTTNLREISSMEAMQFAVSFKSNPVNKPKA